MRSLADCPKCGVHLKLTDWRQHCPHCGANIVVYDLQERLMQQADIAEVQHYHFQKKIDRLKASFVGSKLAVVRIITSFLPVFALILPIIQATLNPTYSDYSGGISLVTIYNGVDTMGKPGFLTADRMLTGSLMLLLASVVLWLVHFIVLTMACGKRAMGRAIVLHALLLLSAFGALLLFVADRSDAVLTGKPAAGIYLYLILLIVNAAVDFAVLRQGIDVRHKQCYVGAIPIEEYFELQKTMTPEALRQEQYRRMQKKREEKEAQIAREQAEKETAAQEVAEESEKKEGAVHGG